MMRQATFAEILSALDVAVDGMLRPHLDSLDEYHPREVPGGVVCFVWIEPLLVQMRVCVLGCSPDAPAFVMQKDAASQGSFRLGTEQWQCMQRLLADVNATAELLPQSYTPRQVDAMLGELMNERDSHREIEGSLRSALDAVQSAVQCAKRVRA